MSIANFTATRFGKVTIMSATSDLTGSVMFYWYIDGAFVAKTTVGRWSIALENNEEVRVDVLDSNVATFDPLANAPSGYPARRSLWWVRSTSTDIASYRIEQQKDGGGFVPVGNVPHIAQSWTYKFLTPVLVDLATYDWQIIPVDLAGNDGTLITIGPEKIVRRPDAPNFTASFDPATTKVTFTAAA